MEKKGTSSIFGCLEANMIDVPSNSWWIDTGASIYIANFLRESKAEEV